MKVSLQRDRWMPYAVPTALLLATPFLLSPFTDYPGEVALLVAIPLAITLGYVFRPERVWVTPLAVSLIFSTVIMIGDLMGLLEPRVSPAFNVYFFILPTIGGPLLLLTWIGKTIRLFADEWRHTHRGSTMTHR